VVRQRMTLSRLSLGHRREEEDSVHF